ncbi:TPA: hypothetical protein SUB30_004782 [Bacillus pseudomycoides]|nr:hypothetical protein [Bacillus pseudomycoides]
MKEFEFDAINSGDGESFCFEVDEDTYKKIKGDEIDPYDYSKQEWVDGDYIPDKNSPLRIYPNDLFGDTDNKVSIKLTVEEI